MSNVDLPGLIVPVEARIDKLEKALKRASATQAKFAQEAERRAKQSADRLGTAYAGAGDRIAETFKKFALPFAGGFLAGGLAELSGQMQALVKSTAEVGDAAKRAGVPLKDFQEWKFVAEQNRIGVDALTDGLKELNLRADEFITTATGSGAEAFKRLGYSASDLKGKLKDPSKLLLEIIGRLEGFDKAAQIRIADEVFGGTGGERFVELIAQGEEGLRKTIDRAHEVGAVMSDEMIRKADELDRKWDALTAKAATFGKVLAVSLSDLPFDLVETRINEILDEAQGRAMLGDNIYSGLADAGALTDDQVQNITGAKVEYQGLEEAARRAASEMEAAASAVSAYDEYDGLWTSLSEGATRLRALSDEFEAGKITGEAFSSEATKIQKNVLAAFDAMAEADKVNFSGAISELQRLGTVLSEMTQRALAFLNALRPGAGLRPEGDFQPDLARFGNPYAGQELPTFAPDTSTKPKERPFELGVPDPARSGAGRGGAGGGRSRDEFAQAVEDIQREKAALEAESLALMAAAAAGRNYANAVEFAHERAKLLTAAQREGKEITPELTAEIDRLADAYVQAGDKADEAADKLKQMEDRAQKGAEALTDTFMSVLDGSKSAKEALADLLREIAEAQLRKHLMGFFGIGGPGAGVSSFVGGLLGFASGGYTGDGGKYEPAGIVHKGEYVMSKAAVQRIGVDTLARLHGSALQGYVGGGLVGDTPKSIKAAPAPSGESVAAPAPNISITAPVTVNASGGTPEQNADLAKQVASQSEAMFRRLVQQELTQQMRPGGMLRRS